MLTREQFIAKLEKDVKDARDIVERAIPMGGRTPVGEEIFLRLAFDTVLHRLIWMKTTDFKDEEDEND